MGILINTGFDLGSSSPIDNRTVKNTIGERDVLISDGLVYENLKVYCKDTQKEYRWTGTEWKEVGTVDLSGYAKTYTSLTELGLTAPVSVSDIFNAMPNKTMAVLACEAKNETEGTVNISDIPMSFGVLTIKKSGVGRFSIEYQNSLFGSSGDVKRWMGTLKGSDGTGLYWKQLSAEPTFVTLSDIGLTADATFQDVVDTLPKGSSALLEVKAFTNYKTIFPYEEGNDQFARVHIVKGVANGSIVYARWFRKDGVKEAIANFSASDNKFSGWRILQTDIVDNLTSIDTDKPLSANQGKVLKDELGLKANDSEVVKKTDITTTIDGSSTDSQLPSAKAVHIATVDKNLKTYTSIEQLGLTTPTTVGAIYNAIPANSCLNIFASLSSVTDLPLQQGLLSITKISIAGFDIIFKRSGSGSKADNTMYIGQLKGIDGTGLIWKRVCITNVADVPVTSINIINGIVNPDCKYQVKNGICYIQFNSGKYSLGETVSGLQLATGLPIPSSGQVSNTYVPWASGDASKQVIVFVDRSGSLLLHAPVGANESPVFCSFSYPVAES